MKLSITICLLLLCSVLSAQNYVDLVRLDYDYGLPRSFEDDSDKQASVKEITADITIPIVLSKSLNLITGLNSEWINTTLYSSSTSQSLKSIMLKLGVNIKHSSKLSGTYILLPKISSDQLKIGKNNLQLGGLMLWKYSISESSAYKFGMYCNSDLFGPMIVPIFGFYKQKGKLETNLTLPLSADINYRIKSNTRIGLKFTGINKSYHLHKSPDQYVVKINNEIGPYIQVAFGRLNLSLQTGTTVLRSYRTYQVGDQVNYAISLYRPGDTRQQLNTDFKDGLFIKTSLIYRFSINS